jgi:predicted MFS family arabinose efflux permease
LGEDQTEGHQVPRLGRAATTIRRLALDITPLKQSRDFRVLWFGELVSMVGRQITVVALPYQVFLLTHSSFAVGLIGLAQLVPLILVSIGFGGVVDRVDRRKVILITEAGIAVTTVMLLAGAAAGKPPVGYLYVVTGVSAAIGALNFPARSAAVPNLVPRDQLPAALALNQVLFNGSMVIGPAVAGLIIAQYGLSWAYGIDVLSSVAAMAALARLRPMPPKRDDPDRERTRFGDIREGFRYLRGRRVLLSTFLIDLDAMIFGMPRALFPVLALTIFHVGPKGLGLLYAAPAAGALAGALTTGWVGRVRRQGLAVVWAVILWGLAITGFGLSGRVFWLAMVFLAFAGVADVISAVFRGTILQLSIPDALRGRMSAVHIMVVTGGPRLGDVEAGWVASLVSPWFSVVSGGIACVAGAAFLALLIPELVSYRTEAGTERNTG